MNQGITTIDPTALTTRELHSILLTAVAPRPIALASSIDLNGFVNLSPFSFFNVFSANPPILIFSPARRVKDNTTKHTLENAKTTKEVVINVVNHAMTQQMSLASTEYEKGVNEFIKTGFTETPSTLIKPPRVAESPVSFECIVDDIIALGTEGGAGNLIISRVVCIHINNQYLNSNGKLDTEKLDLVARMGGSFYAHITKDSLFEIPKPITSKGIGVDSLPSHVLTSNVLTGNDLGRLGNLAQAPTLNEINELKKDEKVKEILAIEHLKTKLVKLHLKAKEALEQGFYSKALTILFCI